MKKRMKVAVIAAVIVLGVGTVVFAQSGGGNFRQNGEPGDPLTLDGQVSCSLRGGSGGYGNFGGGSYDDESGNGYGYGGNGFSCH